MKKILAFMLTLALSLTFASCGGNDESKTADENKADQETEVKEEVKVMTHDEYIAAEIDAPVVVETYVQAKQSWWENKGTFYMQSEDGAYFVYEMACTEDEYNKLIPGTKVSIKGFKTEWSGEVEIVDAEFAILEGEYIAEAFDATDLLGTDDLIKHQNKLVSFNNMTVKSIEYKNDKSGDDIYVTLTHGEADYSFCVEAYLTNSDSEVYKTVESLNAGDVINVETPAGVFQYKVLEIQRSN